MPPIEFTDLRVLVAGGSGVLGSAIARELSDRGANVVLAGRDATRLEARATEIGHGVGWIQFDLRRPDHAEHAVTTAASMLGGLDGVVNAAGVVAFGALHDLEDAVLDELVATDLVGPIRLARAALDELGDGGFIVNITGVVAESPVANMAAYSAVKAGLSAASTALSRELRRRRIHVLDARPPHTETGLATRPIAGAAPTLPTGLDPGSVARRIVDALVPGLRELPAGEFEGT